MSLETHQTLIQGRITNKALTCKPKDEKSHAFKSSSSLSLEGRLMSDRPFWRDVLPSFVKEAKQVKSVSIAHNVSEGKVSMRLEFQAATEQAKDAFLNLKKTELGGEAICDGWCGGRMSAESSVQFGLCDHNFCLKCAKSSTIYCPKCHDKESLCLMVLVKIQIRNGFVKLYEMELRCDTLLSTVVKKILKLVDQPPKKWFMQQEAFSPDSPIVEQKICHFIDRRDTLTIVAEI